jgi:hypothetical protein
MVPSGYSPKTPNNVIDNEITGRNGIAGSRQYSFPVAAVVSRLANGGSSPSKG